MNAASSCHGVAVPSRSISSRTTWRPISWTHRNPRRCKAARIDDLPDPEAPVSTKKFSPNRVGSGDLATGRAPAGAVELHRLARERHVHRHPDGLDERFGLAARAHLAADGADLVGMR